MNKKYQKSKKDAIECHVSIDIPKIKKLRESERLSIFDLAMSIDSDPSTLSKLESGKIKTPTIPILYKISRYFNITMEELLIVEDCPFIQNYTIGKENPQHKSA